ncbi:hypothetical protein [Sphingomonas sp. R1]|uniref:hypothetical protein n=1 Tax=Sphingomonas sp. R1 TaxID=399176 RepID=UPI0022241AD2|nr:hypothetical protein [Sphingomonas sp. R1]UYY78870.1 hypothetical protein OIM94_07795 [Sphingomonas sp. R1]
MRPPPMDAPAELRHRIEDPAKPGGMCIRTVARGPLMLLVHALCAVEPAERRQRCWIEIGQDVLDADAVAALLHHWEAGVPIEDRV